MIRFIVIAILGLYCATNFGEQKSWVQMAVDAACLKIYEESLQGKQGYKLALEDLKKSANIENHKIESNASKNAFIQQRILDSNEDMLSPLIINALKANLKEHDSFEAYLAAVIEANHQRQLKKQKAVESGQ